MYQRNPSFDLPRNLIYGIVDHAYHSLIEALNLVPERSKAKPWGDLPSSFWYDVAQSTAKEFRFTMPHDGKKSTLKLSWQPADRATSLQSFAHYDADSSLQRKQQILFPGAAEGKTTPPKRPSSRNWYNHFNVLYLYINQAASFDLLFSFLLENTREKMKTGINYFRIYLTALVAHELTHTLDVLLSCPFGSLDPTDRIRYKDDYDYYYNCDIEVRANQNAIYWVMEELKMHSPEYAERLLGNTKMEDNLINIGILAPSIDWRNANKATKKIFHAEIKEWQKANRALFKNTLFKSPPKKKPTKRKPAKKKPSSRTRRKTSKRK